MAERLRLLQALTAALGDAVTVDDVARSALTAIGAVPGVVRAGLAVSHAGGRTLNFVSTDQDALSELGVRWCTIDGLDDVPLAHVVRTGVTEHYHSLDELEAEYPHLVERQRHLGTRALAAIPLFAGSSCVGGLLLSFSAEQEFDQMQQEFLWAVSAQVAQALRRGLVYQVHYSTSEQLQRSLMPHALPDLDGLALGAHYQPGGHNVDVGGDWYDVLPLADGSVAVVLGDVMGKGVPAAIVMSEVRAATRAYALLDPTPEVVIGRLDRLVTSLSAADQIVTLVYGLVHPDRSSVTLAVAGHPPPLLIEPSGRPRILDGQIGPALGLGAGPWPHVEVPLRDSSTLLLYSDGLVETRHIDLFEGLDRLSDVIADMGRRRRNPRELCARLGALMFGDDADDDVTVLAVSPAWAHRSSSTVLPADASAAGAARRFVEQRLTEWSLDEDTVETAKLCVSELVTNAVIHTGTAPRLTVRADDEALIVLVQDSGGRGTVRQVENEDPESISGRGLTLIDALTTAWGAEHSTEGATVWFELEIAPRPVRETAELVSPEQRSS